MDVRAKTKPWDQRNGLENWETGLGKTTKKISCIESSQEHLASIILNGWSLKQSGLFLDLASWPNWAIEGEGSWFERWSRHWWSLWLSSMILSGDGRNLQKDEHHCDTPPIWAWWQSDQTLASPQYRHMKPWLEFTKIHQITLTMTNKKILTLVWWTSIP